MKEYKTLTKEEFNTLLSTIILQSCEENKIERALEASKLYIELLKLETKKETNIYRDERRKST